MSLKIWRGADESVRLAELARRSDPDTTAFLPSPPELDGELTVIQQAIAVATAHGLTEPPELADFVVELLDADDLIDKPTWHFSRGEQQIAGLVIAFARPFERLILIDPTAGLDPRRARDVARFLFELGDATDIDIATDADVFR